MIVIGNKPIHELVRRSVTSKPGEGIADTLARSGWSRAPGGTQKREPWSNGGLKGSLRLSGPVPYFTVTLEVRDPTEEEDLDLLLVGPSDPARILNKFASTPTGSRLTGQSQFVWDS